MVFFNHATRQMTTKIVYYGPGLCGKTTNLNTIYARTSQKARGEMVSLNTETDRTLFFDLLPLDVGMVGGFKAKLQLYTVPGQVFYNSTRKLVLKGVDGIVFVADSQVPMLDANRESLQNLSDNLKELGLNIADIPMVFQWNKRDLKNIVPVEVLEAELNPKGHPSFQSIAQDGTGVFETLRGITRIALTHIKALHLADASGAGKNAPVPEPLPAVAAAPVPAPAPEPVVEPLPSSDVDAMAFLEPPPAEGPEALQASDVRMPDSYDSHELPPLPEALSFLDLPSAKEMFKADPVPPPVHAPAPSHDPKASDGTVQVMAPLMVKLRPPQAKGITVTPGQPMVVLKPLAPHVTPKPQVLAPRPGLPLFPTSLKAPGGVPVLHVALPQGIREGDLEVVVLIRQNGATLAETTVYRPNPGHGGVSHLSLEIKGS
jgi:signal recognition particle receptor subunit beta